MKRTSILAILIVSLAFAMLFAACSKETNNEPESNLEAQEETETNPPQAPEQMNDEMPVMEDMPQRDMPPDEAMDDRFAQAIEACNELSEGDSCTTEGPMGEEEGTCTFINEELSCMMERPDRMREPPEIN